MLLAGESGIAIFSNAGQSVTKDVMNSFHIAFRTKNEGLEDIRQSLSANHVPFTEEDHTYFKSVYFKDPDGYRLEVTMKVLDF